MTSKNKYPYPIIFTHTSRTGGGCLSLIIEREIKRTKNYQFYVELKGGTTKESIDTFLSLPLEEKRKYEFLGGHVNFGLHQYYDHSTYITLFRDPVKRIISYYTLALTDPSYYLHRLVMSNKMTLKDFVSSGISPELNNGQTRMLSAIEGVPFGKCTQDMLDTAKSHLDQFYPVFGITEQYDETVMLMKEAFGWRYPLYKSRNVAKITIPKEQISEEVIHIIKENNALDIELYNYAKSKFQLLLNQQDEKFHEELKKFKTVNKFMLKYSKPERDFILIPILKMYSKLI